ncbi:MAG TPA: hypothetical protein VHF22_04795, partial [Planctomycetota bacterium]|nr:hypothetical protein [Planctomycetota bacterium]
LRRRIEVAAVALAAALAIVGAAGASGARAQDKGKEREDPLRPNAPYAADGVIQETLRDGEKELKVTLGKHATAILDLEGKYPIRVDRAETRGAPPVRVLRVDRRAMVLGRPFEAQQRAAGGIATVQHRIAPWHALVIGEGFEPDQVPPAAKSKFGDKTQWFKTSVVKFDLPNDLWVKDAAGVERLVTVGQDDRILTTTAYESADFQSGDLRKSYAKGVVVRFKGTINSVIYYDQKGRLVQDTEKRKAGNSAEIRIHLARLAFLDKAFPYETVETPETF